jgi:hypothetical protein
MRAIALLVACFCESFTFVRRRVGLVVVVVVVSFVFGCGCLAWRAAAAISSCLRAHRQTDMIPLPHSGNDDGQKIVRRARCLGTPKP